MKHWRPDGWEYQDVLLIDIDSNPKKTWDVAHSYGWSNGYEAGADTMLEVLLKDSKFEITTSYLDKDHKLIGHGGYLIVKIPDDVWLEEEDND